MLASKYMKEAQIPRANDWNARAASEWRAVTDERLANETRAKKLVVLARVGLTSINDQVWQGRGNFTDVSRDSSGNSIRIGTILKAEYPQVYPKTEEVRDEKGMQCDTRLVGVSERARSVSLSVEADLPKPYDYEHVSYSIDPFTFRFVSSSGGIEHAALRDFEIQSDQSTSGKREGVIYFSKEFTKRTLEIQFRDPVKNARDVEGFFDKAMLGYVMAGSSPDFEWQEKFAAEYRALIKAHIGMTGFKAIHDLGKKIGK